MTLLPAVLLAFALQDHADPLCTADIRWAVTGPQSISRGGMARALSFFSAVGQSACEPSELQLTVAYFDAAEELICSGVIDEPATQRSRTQMTTLELKVANMIEFVRWRNGPAATSSRPKQLECRNADGTALVQPADLERASWIRLYATVRTRFSGLATAELRLAIQP